MNEIRDLIIGIDIGKEKTQICYYDRKAQEPRSLSVKAGSSLYEVPTCLCRRMDQGDYCVGIEAEYFAREKDGILIDNLYEITKQTETIPVAGEEMQPWELTAVFLKGMLKFLGVMDLPRNTRCLAITVPSLTAEQVTNFRKACAHMGFSEEQCMLLDYGESFFYYALSQKTEIWNRSVGWYDFAGDQVTFRKLSMNGSVTPVLVRLEEPVQAQLSQEADARDLDFCELIHSTLGTELFSSIQLTGNGFDQSWARKSVKQLCYQKRKVFYGNNLFARGACAAGKEKLEDKKLKGYLYMSDALVLSDVGMDMRIMGAPAYYPLIQAGKNWYDCKASCELILDDKKELIFTVETMGEAQKKRAVMQLNGLPARPNKTTRLSLEMEYISPRDCRVTVRDLGFGDLYPSSGKVWKETVQW